MSVFRQNGSPRRSNDSSSIIKHTAVRTRRSAPSSSEWGTAPFADLITDLSLPVTFDDEHMHEFIDWNQNRVYKLERGEGECTA